MKLLRTCAFAVILVIVPLATIAKDGPADAMRKAVFSLEVVGQDLQGQDVSALGTGFIIDSKGYALTSAHVFDEVVENGAVAATLTMKVRVADFTGGEIGAKLVDRVAHDVALLKLDFKAGGYTYAHTLCSTGFDLSGLDLESAGFPFACSKYDGKAAKACLIGAPRFLHLYGRAGQGGDGQTADTSDVLMRFDYGASGSPVFLPNGVVVGIAKGVIESSQTLGAFVPLSWADALTREIPGAPACIDLSACTDTAAPASEKFTVSGGARAGGPGFSGSRVTDVRDVCYGAPPDSTISGQVVVTDSGKNGGRGSISPVDYKKDADGAVTGACVKVTAWSDDVPFGAGGWQNVTLNGFIVKKQPGQSEIAAARSNCTRILVP